MPVVSLPSEKVPAPPSPNCTFDSVSSLCCDQNVFTLLVLLSTSPPRSRTRGRRPAFASVNAANIPAGPKPATTGLNLDLRLFSGKAYSYFCVMNALLGRNEAIRFSSFKSVSIFAE